MTQPRKIKAHVVTRIARQYEGEMIFIDIVKASTDLGKIQEFMATYTWDTTQTISGIDCLVEVGVIQNVDLEVYDDPVV